MKLNNSLILDIIYPIGSYYWNSNLIDIDNVIGGHWERVKDRFVLAVGDTYPANDSGGSASHSHTLDNGYAQISITYSSAYANYLGQKVKGGVSMNADRFVSIGGWGTGSRGITDLTALGGSTDTTTNLPPYETAYCWKRIS